MPDNADLTFKCSFEDWVDVAAGREDPRLAMLKGKIRPKGSLQDPLADLRSSSPELAPQIAAEVAQVDLVLALARPAAPGESNTK